MKLQRILLILATFFLIGGFSTQYIQAHQSAAYHESAVAMVQKVHPFIPVRIVISHVGIDSVVKPGGIVGGQWVLSDTFVHFLSLDQKANKILFYAHERKGLFVSLKNVVKGDTIEIFGMDGKVLRFQVYSIERIKPSEVDKLYGDSDSITLYTCDGVFDQLRLLVKAKLIK